LLITPKEITIERAVQRIKGGFSHAYGPKLSLGVWQRGFVDRRIRNGHEFEKAVSYIHDNPVAAHLADSPEQFAWSSACGAIPMDSYPSN
jgi:putative transposase